MYAEDLYWSESCRCWVCSECWDDDAHGTQGIRLDREIERQNVEASRREPAEEGNDAR